MLVLRLLLMVVTIICLMDGHAEVSSSITGIRNGGESPAVKPNKPEVQILDRKKKKGKKKPKPKKPSKPNSKPTKPVTMKTTTTSTMTTTASATTTASTTTTVTTAKTTTSAAPTSITTSKTTSVTTSKAITSTPSVTKTTTATTSSPPTTAATTADSGAGGECKATNGKPCIFPFKDGKEDYNECKNEGGKYFWCATAVYDSGKYKHWSYCPKDRSCPLEGDGECRAENNKPCVFPFKDGEKEYNKCADHGGKYFWCATGTNSAGKYTAWSKCPKDGSCPLLQKAPTSSTAITPIVTTPPTNDSSATENAFSNIDNKLTEIGDILNTLETTGYTDKEKDILDTMADLKEYFETGSLTRNPFDPNEMNYHYEKLSYGIKEIQSKKTVSPGFLEAYEKSETECVQSVENGKLTQVNVGAGRMFYPHTVTKTGTVVDISTSSSCCSACKIIAADSQLFEYLKYGKKCECYKIKSGYVPKTMFSYSMDSDICPSTGFEWAQEYEGYKPGDDDNEDRLIGGCETRTYDTKWPWIASIRNTVGGNPKSCTGALISCKHVITALHCVLDDTTSPIRKNNLANVEVFVGSTNIWQLPSIAVTAIFNLFGMGNTIQMIGTRYRHDIAVLKLGSHVCDKARGIWPISLPSVSSQTMDFDNFYHQNEFWVAGWGSVGTMHEHSLPGTDYEPISTNELRETNELYVCVETPRNANFIQQLMGYPRVQQQTDLQYDILFYNTKYHAHCPGDSGSPGMQKEGRKWYLYTITNSGTDGCGYGETFIGINKRVIPYLNNIRTWMTR